MKLWDPNSNLAFRKRQASELRGRTWKGWFFVGNWHPRTLQIPRRNKKKKWSVQDAI
jgi:hypothetical protein